MANGFKVFSVGEVLTAADVNDYLMEQSISIFANSTARDAQITSPIEGQFCYLADSNVLQFYNGSSWASFIGEGDITGVTITTAGTSGLSGGATATSGAFSSTLAIAPNSATAATVATGDIVLIGDADDSNSLKKTTVADVVALAPYLQAHNRWYISADITGTNAVISSNWVKSTSANDTFGGGDMSQSSGVFTFPSTGYWLIRMEAQIDFGSADTAFTICNFSNNNFTSSSTLIQLTTEGVANTEFFQTADRVFKVTDTSNDKVNFELQSYGGSTTLDCGGEANTNFQFTKLRDI